MLLAVFSDTHGNIEPMCAAIRAWQPDMALHLGDHVRDALAGQERFPTLDLRYVRGNCDLGAQEPEKLFFSLGGVDIFATHGHLYDVKWQLDSLRNTAYFSGAKLCLFGHTHQRLYWRDGGTEFLNPGTAGQGQHLSAALITIENGTAQCRIKDLQEVSL